MTQHILQNQATSFCMLENVSVFLDRKNDKYHYIDHEKTQILNAIQSSFHNDGPAHGQDLNLPANTLLDFRQKGLLTTTPHEGKPLHPVTHSAPCESVYDIYWKRRVHPITVTTLAWEYFLLYRRLKHERLYDTTQRAETLKADVARKMINLRDEYITTQAKQVIDSRYFLYSYQDKCLFDSCLFFTYFLKKGIPVDWVFGVDLFPFHAHCWVEYKGRVLNDHLERVMRFTPIYVV